MNTDLNRKSEWGTPRIPQIAVYTPGNKDSEMRDAEEETETEASKFLKMHIKKGTVRLRYRQTEQKQDEQDEETTERDRNRKRARKGEAKYEYREISNR